MLETEYSNLDHSQETTVSTDNYSRLTYPSAKDCSDNFYGALNEGVSTDLKMMGEYSILKGPPPGNGVNPNTSNEVYSSLSERGIKVI